MQIVYLEWHDKTGGVSREKFTCQDQNVWAVLNRAINAELRSGYSGHAMITIDDAGEERA